MKVKKDFVTNSSSTSFIITFKADTSKEDEFIYKFNRFLEKYIKNKTWDDDFQEPRLLKSDMVTQVEPGVFAIRDFVAFYGGEEDLPQYVQELFIDKDSEACKELNGNGIIPLKTEIKDLNE
jgi:hypothetical protein